MLTRKELTCCKVNVADVGLMNIDCTDTVR